MEKHDQSETFRFTYSGKQQEEVKRIRSKYLPPEEDKMAQLRRLDNSVHQKATMVSIVAGVVGSLVLGVGMCCCMVWAGVWFVPGIVVGVAGIGLISCAYPLYVRTVRREREKIAPEVLRLTDELLGGPGADT